MDSERVELIEGDGRRCSLLRPELFRAAGYIIIMVHCETGCGLLFFKFMDSAGCHVEMVNSNVNVCPWTVQQGEPFLICPPETKKEELYYLSNLDQNLAVMVRTIYCFRAITSNKENKNNVELIKRTLEKVLVPYYPFAGRLTITSDDKLAVNCNGEGVLFVEAEANFSLNKLENIRTPNASILNQLVYELQPLTSILEMPLLMAQVTKFKCGGLVLGLSTNHCICDGIGAMEFLNSWGEIARGLPLSNPPFLDRTILKPRSPLKIMYDHLEFSEISLKTIEPCEDRVFALVSFSQKKLAELKDNAGKDEDLNQPCTTFQALSAVVWRKRTLALNLHPDQETKLLFAVDVRSRVNPVLPKGYFGNGIVLASALCKAGELINSPLSFAVKLVQECIENVTDDFIKSVIDHFEVNRARPSLSSTLVITTWTKLMLHSMDFGWGQPSFAWPVGLAEKEVIMFLPHGSDKKGINVFLGLPASAMKSFQELIDT